MKTLITRTITGAIFAGCTIGSVIWDPFPFAGLMMVFSLIATFEFYRLFLSDDIKPQVITGLVLSGITYFIAAMIARNILPASALFIMIPVIFLPFCIELYRKTTKPFPNIAITLMPLFYIALPMASLNFLFSPWNTTGENYPNILLGFFFLIWTGDTMAYLGGMAIGRHRLFERISPKKSWEGSIIGGIFSLGMAWILSLIFKEYNAYQWMGMAAVIIVTGTFGDLVESMLKRSVQIKDSGNMLPGHGGFLDRFDGVFLSAPFVFLYINIINGTI